MARGATAHRTLILLVLIFIFILLYAKWKGLW